MQALRTGKLVRIIFTFFHVSQSPVFSPVTDRIAGNPFTFQRNEKHVEELFKCTSMDKCKRVIHRVTTANE